MDQFLSFAHNANTLEEISDFVNNHFAKLEFLNPYDVTAQKVYVDIYNNSCNYWRDSSKKCNLNSLWPKPSSWVIINDGIGAILASPLGPIGSITLGTIFSVGTNEEIGQE
ncbi:MAG: hypothetical protein H6540_03745 [Bacteroidales bacterium]|nr:hypothetical protein [Bacteroidales bacterium]